MNQLTQRMVTWITWERVGLFIAGLALGLVLTSVIVSALVPAYPRDAEVLTLQMDANSASGQFRSTSLHLPTQTQGDGGLTIHSRLTILGSACRATDA
jgi:hypothetical protein